MAPGAPYGSWSSPITAELLVSGAVGISEVVPDGADVWWGEARPDEGGRTAIVRWSGGDAVEVTPADADVRTLAHEYGGGAWWAARGVLFYVEAADQRLRRLAPGEQPLLLTPEPEIARGDRYADGRVTPDGRWFVCVRERHRVDLDARNEIVAVAGDGSGTVRTLVAGPDFVSFPRPSPDGTQLAWTQWDHPNMPWDGTELWVADLADGEISGARRVGGGSDESVFQPEWAPDGRLAWVSDRNGWWNLVIAGDDEVTGAFEIGTPQWVFNQSRYAFTTDGRPVWAATRDGFDRLHLADESIDRFSTIASVRAGDGHAVFVAGSHDREPVVARVELTAGGFGPVEVLRAPRELGLAPELLTPPEPIEYPTTDGETAHALFYPPAHPAQHAPAGERPPLVVMAHGGPTAAARNQLQLGLRYWTSRGFAVVDVDYRGSTGYGRGYRRALDGRWGLADVDDCIAAARHLAARDQVDGQRLAIRGGSAGGFTVLAALAFHDVFAAGASRYGVADLEALAVETHKFESRYLDRLVGPYPEAKQTYVDRSPIHHVDRIDAPMIVLQGLEDEVVPPNQSEAIVDALRAKGVAVAYVTFPDEQHGFRRAANIIRAQESELWFFAHVFGFEPADEIGPLELA